MNDYRDDDEPRQDELEAAEAPRWYEDIMDPRWIKRARELDKEIKELVKNGHRKAF